MEERLAAVEGSICEIELNYATDNYVDERDNRLQDAIDRETAILATHIDDIHDRIDTMEANNTMLINALRDRIDEVRSSADHGDCRRRKERATEARLNELGNSINAIKAGRLLGVVAAGGGGDSVQQQH